jgi:hypothetical protein
VCECGTSAPSATAQHDRSHSSRAASDVSGHATGDAHAACLASAHEQQHKTSADTTPRQQQRASYRRTRRFTLGCHWRQTSL